MPAGALSRLLLHLHEAAFSAPVETAKEALLACLRIAISFDSAIWGSGAEDPPMIFGVAALDFPLDGLIAYGAWQSEDRLRAAASARPGTALRQEDLGPIADHHASPIYGGFCRGAGIEHTLGIADLDSDTRVGELIFLFRGPTSPAFSDSERDLLEQCFPHLLTARRRRMLSAFARPNGKAQPSAGAETPGYAIVDDGGHVHASDHGFGLAMRRAFPGWLGPLLPEPLVKLVGNGASALKAGGQRFELRRGQGRHLLRLADPAAGLLSPAERRVAHLFAQGATSAQVAEQLCLSPLTVRNHVTAIYQKLGIHSKAELARTMARLEG
jgi:DNA-binding CsgD family transcriptional regulator